MSSTVSGGAVGRRELRHQLHDPIRERQHPVVVRGHHHDPLAGRELTDQAQHLLDLDEVEVRGRFVGEDQRRIERDRAGDRDALLLSAAQVAGPMGHPVLQADLGRAVPRPVACDFAREMPAARSGTITFSSAVRLATRLNAWNTMPTVLRR